MNRRWNTSNSTTTHERLVGNAEEWEQDHTVYRKARETWTVVPDEEMVTWCRKRPGKVVGDFGCGEALLGASIEDVATVHSFDHVAIGDSVTACDMAEIPLDDNSLDVAVFSLSLMGANFIDCLREAHRTLRLDGLLHIWEATSRFDNAGRFADELRQLGFDVSRVEERAQFTHIIAVRADREPKDGVVLRFRNREVATGAEDETTSLDQRQSATGTSCGARQDPR